MSTLPNYSLEFVFIVLFRAAFLSIQEKSVWCLQSTEANTSYLWQTVKKNHAIIP